VTTIREAMAPLDGAGIHLRPASAAEHGALATILRDPSVADWWQVADVDADVAELLGDPELAIWLIEEAGSVRGLVMAGEETDPMYRHASIDIALVAEGQGRGLGSAAVRTVARWLIDRRGHHRLIIDPSAENQRAIATYAKVGFRPVGVLRAYERWRDGSWHDGLLMDLLADELLDR
jgi:aminoglycoside 6'-N-acetyltransferase